MVMPFRPPKYWPTSISPTVRAASRNVVRRILISFPLSIRPYATTLDSRCGSGLFRVCALEAHPVFLTVAIDDDVVAGEDFPLQDFHRQRVLDQALNGATQRTRTVGRIIAFTKDQFLRRGSEHQSDFALFEQLVHALEEQINDAHQLIFTQRVEDDDFVDAVDELGAEGLTQCLQGFLASLLRISTGQLENSGRANVAGHD